MQYKQILSLACMAFLCDSARAGDVLVILEGRVTQTEGSGLSTGPFVGAANHDTVRLSMEFFLPGNVGPEESFFTPDPDRTQMQVGSVAATGTAISNVEFLVGNDRAFPNFPQVDYLVGWIGMPFGNTYEVIVEDAQGLMFQSNDLAQMAGSYGLFNSSRLRILENNGIDGLLISLDGLQIVDLGPVGINYCSPANPNSTGVPGELRGFGSAVVSANNLELLATNLPSNEFGLFLTSETQGFVPNPAASQGNLCLGAAIGRYVSLVQSTGFNGQLSLVVDWNALPQPTGTVVGLAGQSWNFQVWHRDLNPGQTTNFTDALIVTLQ